MSFHGRDHAWVPSLRIFHFLARLAPDADADSLAFATEKSLVAKPRQVLRAV